MLNLYQVFYYYIDKPDATFDSFVMAYNECHAVNLLYRDLDSKGLLNLIRHCDVLQLDCINPAQFKTK